MLGASGVVEAAVCVEALRRGLLPPTYNLDDPDPACDLDHIRTSPAARGTVTHVLSNSFGFGGHNVSLRASAGRAARPAPGTRRDGPQPGRPIRMRTGHGDLGIDHIETVRR